MANGTRDALMKTAERLMRTRGYMAFSYADLAESVGITKASIHHHFSTKEDLGAAIVEVYIAEVHEALEDIEKQHRNTVDQLNVYFGIFRSGIENGVLPLCGSLAAELSALPPRLQKITKDFFDMQLSWLTKVINGGIARGEFPCGGGARKKAFILLSILEGACFVNWATNEDSHLDEETIRLILDKS